MNKTRMWAIGLVVGALVLAACSSSSTDTTAGSGTASTTTTSSGDRDGVSIEDFAFGPDELFVSVGETVTWTNDEDGVGHTTTSDEGVWQSGNLDPGDSFEFTFAEPGTYTYFCSIHPSMTATITVEG